MLNCFFFFSSSILLHIQHKYYLLFRLSTRAIRIDFFYIREKRTVFDNPSTVCTPCFIFRSYYDYVSNGNKQCTTNALTYTITTFNIGRVFLPDTYIRCARLRLCVRCMYEFIVSTEYYRCDDVMLSLSSQAISRHIHTHKHLTTDNSPKSYNFKRVFYLVALNSFGALRSLPLFLSVFLS